MGVRAQSASVRARTSAVGWSGVAGAAGDVFYADCGWNGVAALIGPGLLVAWRLYYLPLPQSIPIEPPLA